MISSARQIWYHFGQAGRVSKILTTEISPRVHVVDADRTLVALIDEWLSEAGCIVSGDGPEAAGAGDFDLVVVDVPYPRQGGREQLQDLSRLFPGRPILALSSNFFPGIDCHGPIAREIGATCVLAKPFAREALIHAVNRLLGRTGDLSGAGCEPCDGR